MSFTSSSLSKKLVLKSIEAFKLGLEIYNKPTIQYRIEGFSFFICNAWELMLKAKIINDEGESAIYYDNGKTISLSNAVAKVYTDKNQPLRKNLEEIINLRDTATHFITEDHEVLYAPFFQSNIYNFSEQLKRFHAEELTNHKPQNFLTLHLDIDVLTEEEIKVKYSKKTAMKLIEQSKHLKQLQTKFSSNDLYILPMEIELFQTKNRADADVHYAIDNDSDDKIGIVKQLVEPKNKFNLTRKNVIDGVNKQLTAKGIKFNYVSTKGIKAFNEHTLTLIMNYYNLKETFSYTFVSSTRYSQQLVSRIVSIIKENPDVIEQIKKR